jgi:pimeloyl-ACP methyl ester carboxylesterase
MRPVSFAGCFGWLHMSAPNGRKDIAVLLCSGLQHDAMTGHRSFRLLANAFARAGYPVLRFDYPGTGDSTDVDGGEHWAVWQRSIHTAADWLREHGGAEQIVLCGLRFGATLAAVVAEQRSDVVGLILLAPVLRGRSYLRQLAVEANLHDKGAQGGGMLVLHELRLSRETVGLISEVNLSNVALPSDCQVIVYAQNPSPILSACTQTWGRSGVKVNCEDFTGLEPMLRPVHTNHEPSANVARVVEWLCESMPSVSARRRVLVPDPAELRPPGCIESPLQFGPDSTLFGILCRPTGRTETDLVVLIGNSSGDPHWGFARAAVGLSRRLAAAGFASLRFDFAGLADSVTPEDTPSHVFDTDRVSDFKAAIDALEDLGYRRFAIEGLCSGAYHAFHAALADVRVGHLVLVNLPFFEWATGTRLVVWRQLFDREVDLVNRLANLRLWLTRRAREAAWQAAVRSGFRVSSSFAWDSMMRLSERTRTLFLVAEGDLTIQTLADAFGRNKVPKGATVRVIPGLDHSLTGREMQRAAAEEIVSFLLGEGNDPRIITDSPGNAWGSSYVEGQRPITKTSSAAGSVVTARAGSR